MKLFLRTNLLVLSAVLGLAGCGGKSDTNTAIGACTEVMKLNAAQLRTDAEGTQRLIDGCEQAMFERSADEWRCVAAAMQQGKKYIPATDECFKK
jgi:hypothetical protein